ncbi:MAG: WD40/YVTN/BNR-like repeat-containing protein [Chloroflexota bacterium]
MPMVLLALLVVAVGALAWAPRLGWSAPRGCEGVGWRLLLPAPGVLTEADDGQLPLRFSVETVYESRSVLLVGTLYGLYVGEVCQETWSRVSMVGEIRPGSIPQNIGRRAQIKTIAVGPDRRVYIGGYNAFVVSGFTDDRNWIVGEGPPNVHNYRWIHSDAITASPARTGLAYAQPHQESLRGETGFLRTVDGGQTWQLRSRATYGAHLLADRCQADRVYAYHASQGFRRSDDGGATFVMMEAIPEVRRMVQNETHGTFWRVDSQGGVQRTQDPSQPWQEVSAAPGPRNIVSLAASKHRDGLLYAVTEFGETETSHGIRVGGELWSFDDGSGAGKGLSSVPCV